MENLLISRPDAASGPHPVSQTERIVLLDVIRGVAICGILLMNIPYFGRSVSLDDPRILNELSQPLNLKTWFIINFLLEGSMRGLFSLLFGAGAILLIGRLEKSQLGLRVADIYVRRLIWLLIFGLINGYLLNWPGDILYHYAIVGLFLFPFRRASYSLIGGLVLFFILVTMVLSRVQVNELNDMRSNGELAMQLEKEKKNLTEKQKEDLEKWKGFQEKSKVENIRKKAEKENKEVSEGTYASIRENLGRFTTKLETTKFHGNFFFDIIIFMLLGIWLFRSGVLTGKKSANFYWILMIAGYVIGFGWGYLQRNAVLRAGFDPFRFQEETVFPFSLYQVHRVGTTLGHMSLIILMWKHGGFKWILAPLGRMGQMAFTNYLGQSLICSLIFYGYGLGYYGKLPRYELYYVVFGVWIFQMRFSVVWLKYFRFGPLEWLWRTLTYWEKQPIVRKTPEAPGLS
jgi:uncharacterized protein